MISVAMRPAMVQNVSNIAFQKDYGSILLTYTIFCEAIDSFWVYVKQAKVTGLSSFWLSSLICARECSNQWNLWKQVFANGFFGLLGFFGAVALRRLQWHHVERLVRTFRSFSLFGTLRSQAQRLGRGLEFVYLHCIYRPLLFAPRVAEIHEYVVFSVVFEMGGENIVVHGVGDFEFEFEFVVEIEFF